MHIALVAIAAAAIAQGGDRSPAPLRIAAAGRTAYLIVVPKTPSQTERSAAAELKRCLEKSTRATFRMVNETQAARAGRRILVGRSNAVRRLLPGLDWKALGADGIVLKTVGTDIVLTGGQPRGVYYAVCEFLERAVGIRWWAEDAEYIPSRSILDAAPLNVRYVPRIVSREPHFYLPNHSPEWNAHNKVNGHFNTVPPRLGGHLRLLGWCHTFYPLIPPDRYFGSHPEWFSEIGGKRVAQGGQLCVTNEALVEEMAKNALEWIRKEPDAGFISISQNDWHGRCECAKCKAVEEEEGSPSGPLVRFVNAVAERIEREFPDFMVETLAYQYTRSAPKLVKPRKNVVIRLCSIECDFGLPITHPRNVSFLKDLKAWSAIAPNLYIWTYIANFGDYWYPNPCLPVYGPNIRQFADHKAIGVFMQGDSYNAASCFVRLRSWVLARLLWNPQLDQRALTDEFLKGYYSAAAPHLARYLKHLETEYASSRGRKYLTPQATLAAFRMFADAERAVAKNPTLLARVRRERFPLDYIWATEHRAMRAAARADGGPLPGPERLVDAVSALKEAATRTETTYRSEGGSALPWLDGWLNTLTIAPGPPPEIEGASPERIVDLQEGDVRLFGFGDWVEIADDPAASNRKAAKLRTHHVQWAVQAPVPDDVRGSVRVYLSIRAEGDRQDAVAATSGVFDNGAGANLAQRDLVLKDIAGKDYRLIDMGVISAGPDCYVWVAPSGPGSGVGGIWVDRIILVRVK